MHTTQTAQTYGLDPNAALWQVAAGITEKKMNLRFATTTRAN